MYKEVQKRGMTEESQHDVHVFAETEQDSRENMNLIIFSPTGEHTPKPEVIIRSNVLGWGTVTVSGNEKIKILRDALIEICKISGIE